MIDYVIGDPVVCINSISEPGCAPVGLEQGKIYHVLAFAIHPEDGEVCVIVNANKVNMKYGMWCHTRFRKLPKATDEFTEQMRRLKPKAKPRAPQTVC